MASIDEEWSNFLSNIDNNFIKNDTIDTKHNLPPECEELYISTKTKVLFLNQSINIQSVFWKIPIIEYWRQRVLPMDCADEIFKIAERYKPIKRINIETISYQEMLRDYIHKRSKKEGKFLLKRKVQVKIQRRCHNLHNLQI